MSDFYIGLMSGTSMDGIDAALVEFSQDKINLVAHHSHNIPPALKEKLKLLALDAPEASIDLLGEADTELGIIFADAVKTLLKHSGIKAEQITATGSHGQTIRHRPDLKNTFSIQIADANRISYLTGITTVADFRRKDMAAGGEGAPLAPAFHQQVFHSTKENRAVLNIGGISNITFLPADTSQACFGFDTGPGNTLMDGWIQKHQNHAFDNNGDWAASATADNELVKQLMQDSFVLAKPPKSTGREHYNLSWLEQQLTDFKHLNTAQVQSSLCQFTCDSIVYGIQHELPDIDTLIVCGGGAHNRHLIELLSHKLKENRIKTESSESFGVSPDWVEAIAFAWLARQTISRLPGNIPAVTGAERDVVLGAIYPP
ncbi:Anhydro-N-acetylmuramic acid kinase [hydrothermal vent metagenome]|uniref:Anhydro-N-acetylmuramic acid kinase n=1 Tax=hydrothermal vent metagenome TaxID=652676 RepID=A0A3B0Y055_9ZZZZ